MSALPWIFDDGGRAAAGYRGLANDCACRAIAIAIAGDDAGAAYQDIYDRLNVAAKTIPAPARGRSKRVSAREGVYRVQYEAVLAELGFGWTPTMTIGSGCRVHLRAGELPSGVLIARLSRHLTAVRDGVIHDTHDPGRGGSRCVYGYWTAPNPRSIQQAAECRPDKRRGKRGDAADV